MRWSVKGCRLAAAVRIGCGEARRRGEDDDPASIGADHVRARADPLSRRRMLRALESLLRPEIRLSRLWLLRPRRVRGLQGNFYYSLRSRRGTSCALAKERAAALQMCASA